MLKSQSIERPTSSPSLGLPKVNCCTADIDGFGTGAATLLRIAPSTLVACAASLVTHILLDQL